jgi:ABC-type Co2+ transport system permease subunit
MALSGTKLTSPASLVVDAILVGLFFVFIYSIVSPHVPSNDKSMILLWGGLCAACMSGVFWLCVQMFRVVLRAQRADRQKL